MFGWHFKQYAPLRSPDLAGPSASVAHTHIGMDVVKIERVAGSRKYTARGICFFLLYTKLRSFFQFCIEDNWFCLELTNALFLC